VLLDIDFFKAFNDRLGHPAGDGALRDLGARWRAGTRDIDLLARIGGEEFGLVLPGCTMTDAIAVVERLRADMPAGLTASAGITEWASPLTADQVVAEADRALYRAKRDGRDRICLSSAAAA
jgi:diguanylate cyclase (GGDEF)-like protein